MNNEERRPQKFIPTVYELNPVPESHRPVAEVQCPLCTGWYRCDRKCFRCNPG